MTEGRPLPDFSHQTEELISTNPYYQAVTENQKVWREAKRNGVRAHEMRRMSQKIEENMKRVFSDYIDPTFPRLLVAWSFLLDAPSEDAPYYHSVARYPEHIREEDQEDHRTGMYHLNEWATNYAAKHYIEKASSNVITTPMRQAYASYGDALVGRVNTPYTYKAMVEVKKTTGADSTSLDDAVFMALFSHDFTALSDLIAATPALEAANLDELAIAIGKHSAKTMDVTKGIFRHFSPKPTDSPLMRALKNTADSVLTGGQFAEPGVVECVLAGPIAFTTIGALEGTIFGDVKGLATTAALVGGMTASTHPFVLIHESTHGYSANSDYVGLLPKQIVRGQGKGQYPESSENTPVARHDQATSVD